jgi:hypothetical protein
MSDLAPIADIPLRCGNQRAVPKTVIVNGLIKCENTLPVVLHLMTVRTTSSHPSPAAGSKARLETRVRRSILGNKSSDFIAILQRWFRILLQGASVSAVSSFRAVPKVPS